MSGNLREPTIDDLRVKLCWICREEEIRGDTAQVGPARSWVHPCACTLVAHEDCLLAWVKESQAQPSRRDTALNCPQCGTHYSIESDNPFLLRVLNRFDNLTSRAGTYVSLGIVAGVAVSFAGSIYALGVYYGAHAVRVFVGEHMYNVIVGDDPREWSWWTYWNLPLVPLYLVASRLGPVIDTALYSPITLPLLLSMTFPSSTILAISDAPIDLPSVFLSYPPSPSLCLAAYPFVRVWYAVLRGRITRWVLQTSNDQENAGHRQEWFLGEEIGDNGDANINANLQINVDIVEDQVVRDHQPADNNADGDGNGDQVNQGAVNGRPRRVRVTFSSFGRFITRALITPWIASYSGKLLEIISRRWCFLRRILAIDIAPKPQLNWLQNLAAETPALRALNKSAGLAWHRQMQSFEPIWWQNTLGLSLWIVARDAVTLVHILLRKRELQSRRILSRSFHGIDVGTLDLISPAAF